ncbi:uncharacterized protein J3D65DRAFT_223601 [Phyllosticta citribraziliensis]|uniref:NADH dehydrogenase [ubiquinone] 1 alpha subcomplex subunit n=1 Tax=Phyllosticta citribraziliensis TaxID=989973 RepID=A0ABR1M501_9PEZI
MPQPGLTKQWWYKWKALDLPWRKKVLRGFDLAGNTFWEFKDAHNTQRWRRIVQYTGKTHLSDVQVPPVWMQWLRHARRDAPTLPEQRMEQSRQLRMKQLAAQADERWAAKPSALDPLPRDQPVMAFQPHDPLAKQAQQEQQATEPDGRQTAGAPQQPPEEQTQSQPRQRRGNEKLKKVKEPSPWDNLKPAQEWEPESWAPKPARRRG